MFFTRCGKYQDGVESKPGDICPLPSKKNLFVTDDTVCVSNGVKHTLIKRTQQRTVKENSDTFCQLLLFVHCYSSWQLLKDDSRETVFSLSQFRLSCEA